MLKHVEAKDRRKLTIFFGEYEDLSINRLYHGDDSEDF